MSPRLVSLAEQPELYRRIEEIEGDSFPAFILADPVWNQYVPDLIKSHAAYQMFLLNDDRLLAVANAIPFYWNGQVSDLPTYQALIVDSARRTKDGSEMNAICGLQVIVAPQVQGGGHAAAFWEHYHTVSMQHGMMGVFSPIRPTLKSKYPLTSMERYEKWTRDDGLPFDPWLRSCQRQRFERLCIAWDSNVISAPVGQWEEWTGLALPESGQYVVPGGLEPLMVDVERDKATYAEHHVWYRCHPQIGRGEADEHN